MTRVQHEDDPCISPKHAPESNARHAGSESANFEFVPGVAASRAGGTEVLTQGTQGHLKGRDESVTYHFNN